MYISRDHIATFIPMQMTNYCKPGYQETYQISQDMSPWNRAEHTLPETLSHQLVSKDMCYMVSLQTFHISQGYTTRASMVKKKQVNNFALLAFSQVSRHLRASTALCVTWSHSLWICKLLRVCSAHQLHWAPVSFWFLLCGPCPVFSGFFTWGSNLRGSQIFLWLFSLKHTHTAPIYLRLLNQCSIL